MMSPTAPTMQNALAVTPTLITQWASVEFIGGILYVSFFSGPTQFTVGLSDSKAREGVALVTGALIKSATVTSLTRVKRERRNAARSVEVANDGG